jgi:hypothetical protein
MSTAGRPNRDSQSESDIAARVREAAFVRLVAAADGDAVAALGLLTGALDVAGTPYQATVAAVPETADRATDADLTLALGRPLPTADITVGLEEPASSVAYGIASQFASPDAMLALAGIVAGGAVPGGDPLEDAQATGLGRRPGVAVPTTDIADGLAHTTLAHGPFSGGVDAAGDVLAGASVDDPDGETHRRIGSLVALSVAGSEETTARGADAVERLLRPHIGTPFETVGGYADVLDGVARTRPGLAVALAVGTVDRDAVLAAWRDHGRRAHAAVEEATTGRYDGLFVARCDGDVPVGTVARLVRDFRSPEAVVLVVADGTAGALATDETDVGSLVREAATAVGGTGDGTRTRGRARFDGDDAEFVLAFREAQ